MPFHHFTFVYVYFLLLAQIWACLTCKLMGILNCFSLEKRAIAKRRSLVNFDLLNRVLRSEIFLHRVGQLCVGHVILGFTPISNHFQVSKHVIKA